MAFDRGEVVRRQLPTFDAVVQPPYGEEDLALADAAGIDRELARCRMRV